ncbi:hypothetical protein BH23VER1_BH23VER1_03060 [soil metagenome]
MIPSHPIRHLLTVAAMAALALPAGAADDNATSEPAKPVLVEVGGLVFTAAAPWSAKPEPRPMSQASLTYTSTGEGIDPLEADFYYFGAGQGGTAEANVARWKGQFQGEPQLETEILKFGDKEVTLVHITGTYLSGAMFGPKTPLDKHALLGVIAPGKDAPVFIKMTGTEESVAGAKDALEKLVASAYE